MTEHVEDILSSYRMPWMYLEQVIILLKLEELKCGGRAELAERIGIDYSTLTNVINGKLKPGFRILQYLELEEQTVYVFKNRKKDDDGNTKEL